MGGRHASEAIDLYSVALHEAGHVLGLGPLTDPDSVMNEQYSVHTELGKSDPGNLEALYATRGIDLFDDVPSNTLATATFLPNTEARVAVDADITTARFVPRRKSA